MPKKTKTKASEPLPSALTVANPAKYKSTIAQPQSSNAPTSAGGALRAPSPKPKRHGLVTPEMIPGTSLPTAPLPEKTASVGKAASPVAPQTCAVRFALFEPDAKGVFICGGFNDWSPDTTPMARQEDGHWETTLGLVPGRYEYKFLVDGQWTPDPRARENLLNEHGTLNSLVEVKV